MAMCVERRLVATRSPQNLQRAMPGEMWSAALTNSMSGSLPLVKRGGTALPSCLAPPARTQGGTARVSELLDKSPTSRMTPPAPVTPIAMPTLDRGRLNLAPLRLFTAARSVARSATADGKVGGSADSNA